MTRDGVELVRSAFDAWNRRDLARFAELASEDVVWVEIEGRLEGGEGERHGLERLRESLEALFEVWDTYRLEVDRIEPAGNRVLALVTEVARGRASGVEVRSAWGYLVTVENAAITRVEAYRDPREAVTAIRGLGFATDMPGNEGPNGADH